MKSFLNTVIVKPVDGACNMACEYCYMDGLISYQEPKFKVMDESTLKNTINFFCSHQDDVEFIWHGGEPLLAGKNFYRKVSSLQEKWLSKGKRITNFLQTNGTLVDESWASLFANIGFTIGVSLDAPEAFHNKFRKMRSGCGSCRRVLQGIYYLQNKNIFNGVSCCIGKSNFKLVDKIFSFFLSHRINSIKFLRIRSQTPGQMVKEVTTADEYADFLLRVFKFWIDSDDINLEIRDLKSLVDIFLGGNFRECVYLGECERFATVYRDGSVFPCDSFLNNPRFKFGMVSDSFEQVVNSLNFQKFLSISNKKGNECTSCEWQFICRGGCSYNKYFFDKKYQKYECQAKHKFFSKVKKSLLNYGLL